MILKSLKRPFIGIKMSNGDYSKVERLLPTPTYTDTLYSINHQSIILIYVIEGYISSSSQYRWISNIKLGLKNFLFVSFKLEEEFYIAESTDITSNIYTIEELSRAFKAPLVTYPKIMYPQNKKELYQRLCWYGKRLIHQEVFTKEAITSAALLMNKKLEVKYSDKELHKKALGAYIFIDQNRKNFKVKLDEKELKEARSKGGKIRKDQRVQNTKKKIDQLMKNGDFYKPNGKVNITALAKAMNMTRKTIAKYV